MSETNAIRVYVPTAETQARATVEQHLTQKHGGATTYDARGSWKDGDRIDTEDMTVIECVTDGNEPATDAKRMARVVRDLTDESAVMWEVRPVRVMGME